jgi:hypothetical protein
VSRADRLARQAEIEAEFAEGMNARPNRQPTPVPADGSLDYCGPNMRGHRHAFWTSKKDGKRRCYYCCCLREGAPS